MWIAKLKNWHKDCIIRPRCMKYQVTDYVQLINSWIDKDKFYYTELHILQGNEKNIQAFIKDFKKEKSIAQFEQKGNHIITLNYKKIKEKYYSPVFDNRLIYVRPVTQRIDGYEDWTVASWEKQPLMELMKIPTFEMKLLSIQKTKYTDLFVPQLFPNLSPKQKETLVLAIQEGYYDYPRQIHLDQLANISKVKRQTFQESLRRAEKKLVPFLTENMP